MILDKIVEKKRVKIEERKLALSGEELYKMAQELCKNEEENLFKYNLKKAGLSVIGEFKKASPSKGIIVEDFDIEKIRVIYEELGIDCYSILTEEDFFIGSDNYLKAVLEKTTTPIIRKDFTIDFYQIYESKVLGAKAILLIVAVLGERLKEFYQEAKKFNLEVLVEVHNEEELQIALDCGADIIGVNNRNLKNFNTSLENTKKLIDKIPKDKIIVSESGIKNVQDLRNLKELGVDAVLVGEMFMRNLDNKDFKEEFVKFKNGEN